MIDQSVTHKKYGHGIVSAFDGDLITVKFDTGMVKQLAYPLVFERGILYLDDTVAQAKLLATLADKKQAVAPATHNGPADHQQISRDHTIPRHISELIVGHGYTNAELSSAFLVSKQGGMRRSKRTNSLVLIAKHSDDPERNPYEDRWENDGLFHYTGMGRSGDQSLEYMQNRTLNESNTNGVNVYLFESSRANEYVYRGEVTLAKTPYAIQEKDAGGNSRRVYKFPLAVKLIGE
ncbi:restriction endonuclease [Lacticaseibacillus jixiensis]|uniref:restriction endonuclease n=1 Tax=Lacticaseibacillus jixiensis TaxID=3231926 RepID=UPI0036F34E24